MDTASPAPAQTSQTAPKSILDMGTVFRNTLALYRTHLTRLLTLEVVLIIPTILILIFSGIAMFGGAASSLPFGSLVEDFPANGWSFASWISGIFLVTAVVSAFVSAWQQASVLLLLRDPKASYGDILKRALTMTPRVGGLMFLMMIVVLIGFFVFVLPGIYLWILLSQVLVVAVFENLGTAAFRRSRELVRGHWWWVLGVTVVFTILIGLVSAILTSIAGAASDATETVVSVLVSFFLAPLGVCFVYTVYRALRSAKGEAV